MSWCRYGAELQVVASVFDEECERELEKELEKETEKEEELPVQQEAMEEHWDYALIFRVDSPRDLPCNPVQLASVQMQDHTVHWPPTVVCTTNFLSTVLRASKTPRLDEFTRSLDVLVAFSNGEVYIYIYICVCVCVCVCVVQ